MCMTLFFFLMIHPRRVHFATEPLRFFIATFTRSGLINCGHGFVLTRKVKCQSAWRSLLLWCLDNIVLSPFNGSRTVCVPQGQLPVGGEPLRSACLSCFSTRRSFRFSSISIDMYTVLCSTESFLPYWRHQIIGWFSPDFGAVNQDDWKYSCWRQTYFW